MYTYLIKRYHLNLELLYIKKKGTSIKIIDFGGFQSRNKSMITIFKEVIPYIEGDFKILLNTGDKPINKSKKIVVFSFSSSPKFTDIAIPDFIYDSWKEAKIEDFASETLRISKAGDNNAPKSIIGWIGNCNTHPSRWNLFEIGQKHKNILDIMHYDSTMPKEKFISLDDLVKNYRYLIDVEGGGYSGRLKLLFFSKRLLFIQDREYQDFLFQYLRPFENYVPVKNDFSNLFEVFNLLHQNPELERSIIKNQEKLAKKYLTKNKALLYVQQNLQKVTEIKSRKVCSYFFFILSLFFKKKFLVFKEMITKWRENTK